MVGKYRVIDAHCHVFPDKIAEKAAASTGKFYNMTIPPMDGKVSTLIRLSKEYNIDHFVIQSVATTPAQVRSINNFIAETVKEHTGLFTGLGTLHPDSSDIKGDVHHILDLGLHGVKLHPDIQQFKIDDYRCLKIYELCEEYSLPVLMHTGDKRYDFSNPNRLLPILEIYTGMTVIGAHLGGWSVWEEAGEKLKGIPNMYFDCTSTSFWTGPEKMKEYILNLGCDRVLFGSDYPMWHPEKELEVFMSLGLTEEQNRMILSENAEKVYKIK